MPVFLCIRFTFETMATSEKNLSDIETDSLPSASGMRIGIVVSEWNTAITSNLLNGAVQVLETSGIFDNNLQIQYVPGSYELPLGAQLMLDSDEKLDAVICLGCVIQGETKHFDFVCEAVAQGVKDVGLKYNKPVIFGVLTDNTKQQSIDRSGGKLGNKGDEAAASALKMVALKRKLTS